MKKLNTTRTLLSVALMGAFAVAPFMAPAVQADPPRHAPAYGRRAKDKKDKNDKRDRKDERRDDRDDRNRDDRNNDDRNNDNSDGYDNNQNNNNQNNNNQNNNNQNNNSSSYSGTVTNVRSGNSFDLRANGRTYNVYTSSSLPRGLSRGDEVSVYGRLYGDNDIRNASVRITDNNRNDPRRDNNNNNDGSYGAYRNYTGIVIAVRSSREFDVRIGGKTYNVTADNSTSGLNIGDEVRVYARPYGANDLRNASVRITRNR